MAAKLISLSFKPSNMLPQLAELKTFLESEFGRHMPGFTLLDTNLKWGEATISILGRDSAGSLVAVFATVTTQERDFHEVISEGMVAEGWVEENRDEIQRHYGPKGVKAGTMLRMILVAPTVANRSRAVTRALERAGFEVLDYSIFEIATADGPVRAISFDAKSAP